jgi:glycosyltransferase involved in cell wall biosynthesis
VKILFIHQNFPGQFIHLASHLAQDANNQVAALTDHLPSTAIVNVNIRSYALLRNPAPETHPLLKNQEAHILRAEACAAAALQLKREGFHPNVIFAHPGWGEALFIKEVFPTAKLILYCEYYYALSGQDVGFDPAQPPLTFSQRCQLLLKNTTNLLSMEIADAAISPTKWQKNTYPAWAQRKIEVIHDGIDLRRLRFNPDAELTLQENNGQRHHFRPGQEVLTYVARNLEPVRGFDVFMRTLPEVLQRRPDAHAIIVGGDGVSYGQLAPGGRSWKEHMLDEVSSGLDLRRVHFVGNISYQTYLDLLSISRVHTYWTTPFVLSWSLLETASSGLPVVASRTPPVQEFAKQLGIDTHPFFNQERFADAITKRMGEALQMRQLKHLDHISLPNCLQAQTAFLQSVLA